jgi:hypothetical protein
MSNIYVSGCECLPSMVYSQGLLEKLKSIEKPDWVNYLRMEDGKLIGFKKKPYFKHNAWQGGGEWIILKDKNNP